MNLGVAAAAAVAVAVAVAAFFVLGGIWFPLVVSRAYFIALGSEMKTGVASLVGPLACVAVITISDAILVRLHGITTYAGAGELGALIGVGYLTPMVVNIAINPLSPDPYCTARSTLRTPSSATRWPALSWWLWADAARDYHDLAFASDHRGQRRPRFVDPEPAAQLPTSQEVGFMIRSSATSTTEDG